DPDVGDVERGVRAVGPEQDGAHVRAPGRLRVVDRAVGGSREGPRRPAVERLHEDGITALEGDPAPVRRPARLLVVLTRAGEVVARPVEPV
ncbi:MAG: hypothetical protein AVDCRST_MAG65-958, partial [uncultured Solirubrobacteraceae bacterium]